MRDLHEDKEDDEWTAMNVRTRHDSCPDLNNDLIF
jgi:hypothetical protein